jgi:hypothetical protein
VRRRRLHEATSSSITGDTVPPEAILSGALTINVTPLSLGLFGATPKSVATRVPPNMLAAPTPPSSSAVDRRTSQGLLVGPGY